jgi:hypothetical protein
MNAKTRYLLFGAAVVVAVLVALFLLRPRGPEKAVDPLEVLPARCQAVMVVPDPGALGDHLAILPRLKLAGMLATLLGYDNAEQLLGDLSKQAGWDPRSRESMRAAGIDTRPAVGYLSEQYVALLAVPESDPAKLDQLLAQHAANRLGAKRRAQERVGDHLLITFAPEGPSRPGAVPEPSLGWAHWGGYTFLGQGARGVELLRTVLAGKTEGSLAKDPRFAAARARLSSRDLFAFSCIDALPPQKRVFIPYGTSLAASLTEKSFSLLVELPLDDNWAEKLKSLSTPAGADLVSKLDPEAFLFARLGGEPQLAAPLVDLLLPAALVHSFEKVGIDLKKDVAGNLKPGIAAALRLAPTARLGSVPELDVRHTNPFDYLFMQLLARATDPAAASRTLSNAAEVAPSFGAKLEQRTVAGTAVFVTTYHLGEGASLTLKDGYAVVTGGAGQMEEQLKRLGAEAPLTLADPEARRSLQEDGFALYLDVGRLTAGIRALPDSAYGIGGFAIKAALSRWLDAIDEIGSLRLSARLADKTLQAGLALTLKLPPAPPAQKASGAP